MDTIAIMLLVLVIAAGIALLCSCGLYLRRKSRASVVVHLKSGTSIKGVLRGVYVDVVVVTYANAAPSGARDFTDVDGTQAIPRGNVDWIQIIGPGDAS